MCVLTWLCACDVCCGVYVVLWCCVFCGWCVVFCVVWCGLACGKPLHVCVQNTSVFTGKTPACSTHAGVFGYTRRRPDRTHGSVLNAHTEVFSAFSSLLSSLFSLLSSLFSLLSSLFSLLSFSSLLLFLSSSLFLSFSLSSLVISLFSLSNNDNDHSSSRALSQYTRHWLALWARVHVPWHTVWRTCSHHARNNCLSIPVQASCHLE